MLTLFKGCCGSFGGLLAWGLANAAWISTFGAVVGAIVAILTAISVGLDIRKKWKHRND